MPMSAKPRLEALDVLRGLAVAGMILVVSPGDWSKAYAQLQHAAWNGATMADMVFPTFLFSVGVALGLSFPRANDGAARRLFWTRLVRRAAILIVLGLLVEASYVWAISAGAPYPGQGGLSHVRLPGILQRIGLCYLLGGAVLMMTGRTLEGGQTEIRPGAVIGCIAAILVGYWLLLRFVPVPGVGPGQLTPQGSLPGLVDRAVFTVPHLWPLGSATGTGPATYDPEGLLASLPATANLLFGALAAWAWRHSPGKAIAAIGIGGAVLIVAGLALDPVFAINKRLWTSSFVLLSSGVSATVLALLAVVLREKAVGRLFTPVRMLGGNAILAFLLSTLMSRLAGFPLIPDHGRWVSPQFWGNDLALALVGDPYLASLACAVAILCIVTALIWPLHRRPIHVRI
jgi:predicted acyltransferase